MSVQYVIYPGSGNVNFVEDEAGRTFLARRGGDPVIETMVGFPQQMRIRQGGVDGFDVVQYVGQDRIDHFTPVCIVASAAGYSPHQRVDSFQAYAANVDGVTAPHFRLGNGDTIRLHKAADYSIEGVVHDRKLDPSTASVEEVANVLATLITDLKRTGIIG